LPKSSETWFSTRSISQPRKIAKEAGCSLRTVCKIIKDELNFKADKKIPVPALTPEHMEQRKSFSHWIRKRLNPRVP
jgi:hypothetical protein